MKGTFCSNLLLIIIIYVNFKKIIKIYLFYKFKFFRNYYNTKGEGEGRDQKKIIREYKIFDEQNKNKK
jgi:hypothetical protein